MRKNIKKLILSSVLIILPVLLVVILGKHLSHELSAAPFILISAVMLAVQLGCIAFTEYDNRRGQSGKVMTMVYFILPAVNAFVYVTMAMAMSGRDFGIYFVTTVFMGIVFIIVGNYLPKCKRNRTIGIKIKWTLENDANWSATHRFGGKVWVAGGVCVILCAFLPEKIFVPVILASVLVLVFAPMLYSYLFYKRAVKNGEFTRDGDLGKIKISPKAKTLSTVAVIIFLAFVAVIMFTGDVKVSFGEEEFTVEADFWSDLTLDYDDVTSVSYIEDISGVREFGVGSAKLLVGHFRSEDLGKYIRYTYTSCDTAVLVRTEDNVYVIGGENDSATKALYDELCRRTGGM